MFSFTKGTIRRYCESCDHSRKTKGKKNETDWCTQLEECPPSLPCPFHPKEIAAQARRRKIAAALVLDNEAGGGSLTHLYGLGLKGDDTTVQDVCREIHNLCALGGDPVKYFAEDIASLRTEQAKRLTIVEAGSMGRNKLCTCGSGKKYKKCCLQ